MAETNKAVADITKKQPVSKDKLLEAGVHFGHQKSKWNPKMKPNISTAKRGIHIIDIQKTSLAISFAYDLIGKFATKGAQFVFVGTRKQSQKTIKENAQRVNAHYVENRWLGGTLTNSRTIMARIKRMLELEKMQERNFEGYSKKEGVLFTKELEKLHRNLNGIRNMKSRPNVMICADPSDDIIAVKEAQKVGVKVIGIVDTNVDPSLVDIAIPANDDSTKSVTLIMTILADAIAEAKGGEVLFAFKSDDEIELPVDPVKTYNNNGRGWQPRNRDDASNPRMRTRTANFKDKKEGINE